MTKKALFRAVFFGQDDKIVKLLEDPEETECGINVANEDSETVLHIACSANNPATLMMLLQRGADPNARNVHGETPLHYAVINDLTRSVLSLVNCGADINMRSVAGYKPAALAGSASMRELLAEMESNERKKYSPILDVLWDSLQIGASWCDVLNQAEIPRKEKDILTRKLVKFYDAKGLCQEFMHQLISSEVQATLQEPTLFRADSMATKIMGAYIKLVGHLYIDKTIGSLIRATLAHPHGYELDPGKIPHGETVEENVAKLTRACKNFLTAIIESYSNCPVQIRVLCYHLQQIVAAKFPSSRWIAVGGVIFLRYFSAALMTPEVYNLTVPGTGAPTSAERRPLILIAKVLQNLANGVEFGEEKEPYMRPMNAFITSHQTALRGFYEKFGDAPSTNTSEAEFSVENITSADLIFVYTLLLRTLDKLGTQMGASPDQLRQASELMKREYQLKKISQAEIDAIAKATSEPASIRMSRLSKKEAEPVSPRGGRSGPFARGAASTNPDDVGDDDVIMARPVCSEPSCGCPMFEPHRLLATQCMNCEHSSTKHVDAVVLDAAPQLSDGGSFAALLEVMTRIGPAPPEHWQYYF
eukprot:TRINITY_DN3194_c0_g1_i1.p1 TRINITY_DN3194_c0_g1~~TRINITY_DN3194_c0_g1_i1.p1  ORF type:complete len:589 (+),score=143.02 TRINITY_DN3194_c0_g1_i1:184-1950(+)